MLMPASCMVGRSLAILGDRISLPAVGACVRVRGGLQRVQAVSARHMCVSVRVCVRVCVRLCVRV
jgi:hypothetical protein